MTMGQELSNASIIRFFAAERDRLIAYVHHLIDDAAARDGEDIVQDVALSILSRPDILIPIETVSAYVYQSLRNRVIDYFRRPKIMISLDDSLNDDDMLSLADALSGTAPDAESEAARSELRRQITEAIEGLPDDQKAVVVETEVNGRKFSDLSEEWNIPIGTLLARKARGMAKVRESLRDFKP
jgi:RNA polymerase sigma factor (sigma-70 family)